MDPMSRVLTLAAPQRDEKARQQFISSLRRHVMVDMSRDLAQDYREFAAPDWDRDHGAEPVDGREARRAMLDRPLFQAFSALRYNAQEMVWASVQDQVERNLDTLNADARDKSQSDCGSLILHSELPIPRDVTAMDIHLMPGCWHTEHCDDDTAQGAVYELGSAVFGGALRFAKRGSVAYSVAHYLQICFPEFKPARILDIGCSIGTNTLPYKELYPDAEVYGLDVAAPQLRHAHARAASTDTPVHFSQQNAEQTDFEDGAFDLIVSSYLFHELSVKSTKRVLAEIHRLLRPGGLTLHMELPESSHVDAYYNFFLDWDAYYNNEPHYAAFRAQEPGELMIEAGFDPERVVLVTVPNFTTTAEEEFRATVQGEREPPAHGNGASWRLFGAWR